MNTARLRAAVPAVAALAAAAALAAFLLFRGHGPGAATAEAAPRPPDTTSSDRRGSVPAVQLTPAERQALGIETTAVQSSSLPQTVRLPATTALDPDALAHVHPRFAGEAIEVKAALGAHVKKGGPLADLSRLSIWAYAYEDALLKLHVGDPWAVALAARPGLVLHGQIQVIGAVVDPAQHTATVQGTIPNPGEALRAGMFATATVTLPPDPNQVVVPTTALVDAGDHTYVYVQSPRQPDAFRRREVQVRERLPAGTLLTAGVGPGDEVVSRGALELDAQARAEP